MLGKRKKRREPLEAYVLFYANHKDFIDSLDDETRERLIDSERVIPPECCVKCIFYKVGFDKDLKYTDEKSECSLGAKPIRDERPAECPLNKKGE